MTSSIDGLVSGLNTSQVIGQLIQAEASGQNRLKAKVESQQKTLSSLQSVNTRVATMKNAATTMLDSPTWKGMKAASSSTAVTATASSGAIAGQITFDVKNLAQANAQTAIVSPAGSIQDGTGLKITIGDTTTDIAVETDTAQGVVDAINKAGIGVKAALVTSQQGTVLQLNATKTGAANAFTVSGLNTDLTQVSAGLDAQIGVGTVGQGGYTVSSATNTFTNLIPNVTVTANKVENGVTVSVKSDVEGLATKVQGMVDAANGLISEINTQSSITTSTSGTSSKPLSGNALVRNIHQSVLGSVSQGMADYGSFSQIGIQTDRNGTLTFDRNAFIAAYEADPTAIQQAVTEGIGARLKDIATTANTNITAVIQSGNNEIRGINDQVDKWDVRLKARQEALVKQFTNLEVALGKMREQSNWLAGQISSLSS